MYSILCLEPKNNKVTKEQIFKAAVFLLVYKSNVSPRKWNVIVPLDATKASYSELFEYSHIIELKKLDRFIDLNGLALLHVVLSNDSKLKVDYLLEVKPFIKNLLITIYLNLNIPREINSLEAFNYLKEVSNTISNRIKKFYDNFVENNN